MNWKLKERDTGMYKIFEVIDEDGNNNNKNHNLIARFATDDKDYAEIKKKGQLIAAAPELLVAVEELVSTIENAPDWSMVSDHIKIIKEVIQKAKGND